MKRISFLLACCLLAGSALAQNPIAHLSLPLLAQPGVPFDGIDGRAPQGFQANLGTETAQVGFPVHAQGFGIGISDGNPRTLAYDPAPAFYAVLPHFPARSGGLRPIHLSHFGELELYRIRALILYRGTTLYQESGGVRRPLNGGWVMTGGFRLRFHVLGGERKLTGPSERDVAARN